MFNPAFHAAILNKPLIDPFPNLKKHLCAPIFLTDDELIMQQKSG